jgi:long-chain acyl-CoA synthetase
LDSASRIPFEPGKTRALSFTYLSYFWTAILYLYQYYGVSIYFGEGHWQKLVTTLLRPTVITQVPDFWKK